MMAQTEKKFMRKDEMVEEKSSASPSVTGRQREKKKLVEVTDLGADRGLRPSTMHGWPPDLQRLQTFSFAGKSHFI